MTEEITVTIPETLYQRARRLAGLRNQEVADVLAGAITLAEATFARTQREEQLMAREEATYEAMQEELLTKYVGEYVAIHQGKLVDHDPDEVALLRRLDAQYPHEVVLMKRVQPQPEPELRFLSPL